MTSPITTERRGAVLEVTINRPKANAIDAATSRIMGDLFAKFRDDPELRVAILTAAGDKFFCPGWDLKAAAEGEAPDADYGVGGFGGLQELPGLNKPVIAAVNGLALGGGFELVIACDLIICAEHVEFALPELPIGIVPDSGGIQRVPRRLPHNIAMELLLLGRRMPAAEALHYGMINRIVPKDQPMTLAREWAATIAEGAPLTIQALKEALREMDGHSIRDSFRLIRTGKLPTYEKSLLSDDAKEGVRAFAEKRKAVFKGR